MAEANSEDPFKDPIKDLIDEYAQLAEKSTSTNLTAKVLENLGIQNQNNYGNQKAVKVQKESSATPALKK